MSIGRFKLKEYKLIYAAFEDPNKLDAQSLYRLALILLRRALSNVNYVPQIVCYFVHIVRHETKTIFLSTLLNFCKMISRERVYFNEKKKRNMFNMPYINYMALMADMACKFLRIHEKIRRPQDVRSAYYNFMVLLFNCCLEVVKYPAHYPEELKFVAMVVRSYGKEIQRVVPEGIMDFFISNLEHYTLVHTLPLDMRITMLEVLHLIKSKWLLPGNIDEHFGL